MTIQRVCNIKTPLTKICCRINYHTVSVAVNVIIIIITNIIINIIILNKIIQTSDYYVISEEINCNCLVRSVHAVVKVIFADSLFIYVDNRPIDN